MTLKIGINGFGRIGRLALRTMFEHDDFECVGINDLISTDLMAHLFKYDSAHGRFKGDVSADETSLTINGKRIPTTKERDPSNLPWKNLECDIVIEATGLFTKKDDAEKHRVAGAKMVIISAPAKGDVPTFVYNVNHETFDPANHTVISNASCTTNCLAPVAKVLNDNFGVEQGFMTTVHAYTNDQRVVDAPHKDFRRARAAAVSQIPTTTGAAKAVGLVLPDLAGKLDGMAIRVPTPDVSLVDLVATLKKSATADEINAALKSAANGPMKDTLEFCDEPLVSVDFIGNPHGSIVDALSTKAMGKMVKVLIWYDNEIGFCHQMMRMAKYVGSKI
ncbi:MAG: type I glyceraldehyde-3-phosphate dehydrogenase [Deltaproteobacteria bacterium]|jgi:glyceraldehyde 3-phosphate dehydrogenase|nr:type I glyceraldehyde-3-phosphate dehydrogenase [Deltaproteobacteria bacterium]